VGTNAFASPFCTKDTRTRLQATKMQTLPQKRISFYFRNGEKKPQHCFNYVHNPLSTSECGTFESSAVRSEREPHRSIAQFVEARATSLIAQFLEASSAGFEREHAVKREPHRSIAPLALLQRTQEGCKIHVEAGTLSLRASPLINDRNKK